VQLTHPDFIKDVTSEWEGERDANGRPLVSDDILKRMELVTTEEAWGVCRRNGYNDQFAGDWKILHPDHILVGRAVTARYVPLRPDINNAIEELGKKEGRIGGQNSWVIDELVEGDALVIEMFGKVRYGTFAGDNLAAAIKAKGNRGMVIDGGIRDTQRIRDIPDFGTFVRGFDPTAIADLTQTDINGPVRIGEATCMPGDVVLGTFSGVIFIPAHLAEEVVVRSEEIRLKDQFGQQRIAEGAYTPGEVDRQFSDAMNEDFENWKKEQAAK
jgi:regulator of RNase E activity RraA